MNNYGLLIVLFGAIAMLLLATTEKGKVILAILVTPAGSTPAVTTTLAPPDLWGDYYQPPTDTVMA